MIPIDPFLSLERSLFQIQSSSGDLLKKMGEVRQRYFLLELQVTSCRLQKKASLRQSSPISEFFSESLIEMQRKSDWLHLELEMKKAEKHYAQLLLHLGVRIKPESQSIQQAHELMPADFNDSHIDAFFGVDCRKVEKASNRYYISFSTLIKMMSRVPAEREKNSLNAQLDKLENILDLFFQNNLLLQEENDELKLQMRNDIATMTQRNESLLRTYGIWLNESDLSKPEAAEAYLNAFRTELLPSSNQNYVDQYIQLLAANIGLTKKFPAELDIAFLNLNEVEGAPGLHILKKVHFNLLQARIVTAKNRKKIGNCKENIAKLETKMIHKDREMAKWELDCLLNSMELFESARKSLARLSL